eukprot:m.392415 g.392415  ORF g.392415 m.392415 type:complete len:275 (+) comp21078_c2_seq38:89-913(+)
MSADFWKGSQCSRWTLDEPSLAGVRDREGTYLSQEQQFCVGVLFADVIRSLGQSLKMRQQVIATATMYFKRFYVKHSWTTINPYLMALTCVYLATKVEECGPIQTRAVLNAGKKVTQEYKALGIDESFKVEEIAECEFFLVQAMECCLVVFHPYRSLVEFADDAKITGTVLPLAWNIVNDSYKSDLCFLYPPYLIALGCLQIASSVVKDSTFSTWLSELTNVSVTEVMEVVQALLDLFSSLSQYNASFHAKPALASIKAERARRDADSGSDPAP